MTMRPVCGQRTRQCGVTLVEQVMVVAIVGVMAAVAMPSLANMLRRNQVQLAQSEFIGALQHARGNAAVSGKPTLFCPSRDGLACSDATRWESGWLIGHDAARKGQPDAAPLRSRAGYAGITVLGDSGRRLVLQEKVDCVQGLISSGVSLALAPAAEQSRVLTMMWDGTTQDGVKEMLPNPKFVFRSVDNEIGVVMSTLLALKAYKGRITRIAGVNPDYTYGRNAWIAFQAILKKYNVPHTVVSEQWVKAGSMDLSSNIAALQGTKPDLVFSSLLFSDLPVFMRQAHNSGLTESVRFVLPDGGWQQIGLKKEFTPEGVVLGHGSMYFASPTASALQKEFVQDYVNRYKEVPHFEADRAYFCLQMYKAGVEAALVARSGRWPGPAEIAEAIPGLPVPTFGGTASMRPDHIPDMTMYGGLTTHKSNYDFVTLATVETMSTKEIQKPPQADFWQWLEAAKFSV